MLDTSTLISTLTNIFSDVNSNSTPASKAQAIANAIDTFVKSGTVTSNGVTSAAVPGAPSTITNLIGTIS